jgi:hypothetical protein
MFSVLVGTTAALVGNENKNCRVVVMVGILYDICQIAQAIGRLRENQRDLNSMVSIFYNAPSAKEVEKWEQEHETAYKELRIQGVLTLDCALEFDNSYSRAAVWRWLVDKKECLLVTLRKLLGSPGLVSCFNCSVCKKTTPVLRQAEQKTASVVRQISNGHVGIDFIRLLEERCSLCLMSVCDGENCMKRMGLLCYKCGGNHFAKSCALEIQPILKNKACFYCYDLFSRSGVHNKEHCPLKRRLKVAMMNHYRVSAITHTYSLFMAAVFATEPDFYNMLAKIKGGCTSPPREEAQRKLAPHCGAVTTLVKRLKTGKEKVVTTTRMMFQQVHDDNATAPLLPPDFCHKTTDVGQDPSHATSETQHRITSTTYETMEDARSMYNFLKREKKSCFTRRRYVFGSLYKTLFDGYYKMDPRSTNYLIDATVAGKNETSKIYVTHIVDKGILNPIRDLGKALPKKGNGRVDRGDVGDIFALGVRNSTTRVMYKSTAGLNNEISQVSKKVGPWLNKNLPEVAEDIENAEHAKNIHKSEPMLHGPGSSIMMSRNLGNASHLDVVDSSYSVTIWVEDKENMADNWFYIMPNMSYQGSMGVIVRLSHGAVVAWDGRFIRHCTSVTNCGENNDVFGCMFGSCR